MAEGREDLIEELLETEVSKRPEMLKSKYGLSLD